MNDYKPCAWSVNEDKNSLVIYNGEEFYKIPLDMIDEQRKSEKVVNLEQGENAE